MGFVISKNNKYVDYFYKRLVKTNSNYTATEKVIILIVECIRQFQEMIIGEDINIFSDHKNLVYSKTQG